MRPVAAAALLMVTLMPCGSAHRLDEYLQATLIGLTRDGVDVEINLTPGVAVLPAVMAAIDRNGDGQISKEEAQAYAKRVASEVNVRVDGESAPLVLVDGTFPKLEEMQQGLGTIRLKLHGTRTGHELKFENHHLPQISVYLVNCLAEPGDGLTVMRQQRDEAQKSIRFDYSFEGSSAASIPKTPFWLAALLGTLLAVRMAALTFRRKWGLPD